MTVTAQGRYSEALYEDLGAFDRLGDMRAGYLQRTHRNMFEDDLSALL